MARKKVLGKGGGIDFGLWRDAFLNKYRDRASIEEFLDGQSISEAKSFLEMFFKFERSELESRKSILQESLEHLPGSSDLSQELVVAKAEIKRLREQLFIERTGHRTLEHFVMHNFVENDSWFLLMKLFKNICVFYKEYYEGVRKSWISPHRWAEILSSELEIGEEIDVNWEGWKKFGLDREGLDKLKRKDDAYLPALNPVPYDAVRFKRVSGEVFSMEYLEGEILERELAEYSGEYIPE